MGLKSITIIEEAKKIIASFDKISDKPFLDYL